MMSTAYWSNIDPDLTPEADIAKEEEIAAQELREAMELKATAGNKLAEEYAFKTKEDGMGKKRRNNPKIRVGQRESLIKTPPKEAARPIYRPKLKKSGSKKRTKQKH
jgi:hypothetical protein